MQAAFIRKTGTPDVIEVGGLPEPACAPNQVKVRVGAVSVNPIDTYIRNGANYWPLPNPFILGCDFAGSVIEVGKEVRGVSLGQRVWGSNQGLLGRQGTFAETICVDQEWVYPTNDNASDTCMAAVALVGITAHLGLLAKAQLKAKETIFVRGGTGGVSSMVLQMAKAIGARVITTAGSPEKAERCVALGADHVIEYTKRSVPDTLRELAPEGVHVYWETLREPDFEEAVAGMAEGGRMVLMAGRDARPPFPVGPFYVKGCSLHGFAMFKESADTQAAAASDINHWVTTGALKPQIDRVMPLSEAAEAHRLQEANTVQKKSILSGKLVLEPTPSP